MKRIWATVALAMIAQYRPKIEQLDKPGLKLAALSLFDWTKETLDVLTDTNPNDQQQLEEMAARILAESPERFLAWAEAAIGQREMDEAKKALILELIADIMAHITEELDE